MSTVPRGIGRRVFGIETEFGCFVRDPSVGTSEEVVEAVKDFAFRERNLGLIDLHSRDYAFEPARAGGFLRNGGRLYVDAVGSHEEYATPECCDCLDLVRCDRAGRLMLAGLVRDLGLADVVSFHNNSVDHFGGHTFGCHENYLIRVEDSTFAQALSDLLPFLITRQIYAGVGRVGGHRLVRPNSAGNIMTQSDYEVDYVWVSNFYGVELDNDVDFQLSQRADHIVKTVSSRVRFNRAIINPKWDSYYSYSNQHRLHILFGESNMSEYACFLKVGATCLVLDLIEAGAAPADVEIDEPLQALRAISRDPDWRWIVRLRDGRSISAIDLQREYCSAADRHFAGRDDQTDRVLEEWRRTLDDLERDPLSTADRLDWAAKYRLYTEYMASEGVDWRDEVMQSLDLEYHNVDPEAGLAYGLERAGLMRTVVADDEVEAAMTTAPGGTRAVGRGLVVNELAQRRDARYIIDWDGIYLERNRQLELKNPLHTYSREAERFLRSA